MNIVEIANLLKNMPDDQMQAQMQQPSPGVPQYLVMSEMQRRKALRDDAANPQMPTTTVAQDMQAPQPVQGGIADLPQTAEGGPGFAEGGIVSFAEGGAVKRPKTIAEMWGPEPPEENTWAYKLKQLGQWMRGNPDPTTGYQPDPTMQYDPASGAAIGPGTEYDASRGPWLKDLGKKVWNGYTNLLVPSPDDPREVKKPDEEVPVVRTDGTNPEPTTQKPAGKTAVNGGARVVGSAKQNADVAGIAAVPGAPASGVKEIEKPEMITAAQRLKELQEGYVDPYAGFDDKFKERRAGIDDRKKGSVNMALMQAGLAMAAGKSPNALQNLAAGGIQGLNAYSADRRELSKEEQALLDKEMGLQANRAVENNRLRTDARTTATADNRYNMEQYKADLRHADQLALLGRQMEADKLRAAVEAARLAQGDRKIDAMIQVASIRAANGGGGGGGRMPLSEKERLEYTKQYAKLKADPAKFKKAGSPATLEDFISSGAAGIAALPVMSLGKDEKFK